METSQRNYCSTFSPAIERHSLSLSTVHEDILNLSPRLSYHNPVINLDRRLRNAKSFSSHEDISLRMSSTPSLKENSAMKSVPELVKEISTLETEVINMERYLLSLYRTAFDRHLLSSPSSVSNVSRAPSELRSQSIGKEAEFRRVDKLHDIMETEQLDNKQSYSKIIRRSQRPSFNSKHTRKPSAEITEVFSDKDNAKKEFISGHNSLIYHLGTSITDHVPQICCKLSEDIIRCIAAIYCKLAKSPNQNVELLTSPTTSASSSSTSSAPDPSDNWSPKSNFEASTSPCKFQLRRNDDTPYSGMIEVPRICIDGERFEYASKMLHIFRSLIRQLEKIDPRKMKQEEQLAFWINIHNALVMHALLAYGLRNNHVKSRYAIQKAAYDVGGLSVDAFMIQNSILRCQDYQSSLWLGKLFSPKAKVKTANVRHQYALDTPQPLVHFALCSGASSDPALRAYTAKRIYQELEVAKAEFIQANVSVCNDAKIVLPKVLQIYAKDAGLELNDLLKIVSEYMPEVKRAAIERCYKRRSEKCVEWSYKSSFGYILHSDFSKQ